VALFFEGSVRHTGVVGLGGVNITNDLAVGLRTGRRPGRGDQDPARLCAGRAGAGARNDRGARHGGRRPRKSGGTSWPR
jgi:cell division protein FtsA